jgi:beta-mannosidase
MMLRYDLSTLSWAVSGWYRQQWRLAASMELGETIRAAVQPIPAAVPGSIYDDLRHAGVIPDPTIALESRAVEWVANRDWVYTTEITVPDGWLGTRITLVAEGIDYHSEIYLDGMRVGFTRGTFSHSEIDLTRHLSDGSSHRLVIVVLAPPEIDGQAGFTSRISDIKPRFGYYWDWCPRIVPLGIWRDLYLRADRADYSLAPRPPRIAPSSATGDLSQFEISYLIDYFAHADTAVTATLRLSPREGSLFERSLTIDILAGQGTKRIAFPVADPAVWWPHDYGHALLYEAELELAGEQGVTRRSDRVGFRTVALNRDTYVIRVNGREVEIKGFNWVPISPDYGALRRSDYEPVLRQIREGGVNLLRVWGGGLFEHEYFYDLCDELGLMVWQEFPQSSSGLDNATNVDPVYLDELCRVSRHEIERIRAHPSRVVWCGGNELMWSNYHPVTLDDPNIARLAELVHEVDPETPFLPTSPSGVRFAADLREFGHGLHDDVHGPWLYQGPHAHCSYFNADDAKLRSELGTPAPARLSALHHYAGEMALWPDDPSNDYWRHRGSWWVPRPIIEPLIGAYSRADLPRVVSIARAIQAESLRYAVGSGRARFVNRGGRSPRCAGTIVWMGNESFPNASNTSVLEYDASPKPAYYALRRVWERSAWHARFERLDPVVGESVVVTLVWLDGEAGCRTDVMRITIVDASSRAVRFERRAIEDGVIELFFNVPHSAGILVRADSADQSISGGQSDSPGSVRHEWHLFPSLNEKDEPLRSMIEIPPTRVELQSAENGAVTCCNTGTHVAFGVTVTDSSVPARGYLADGYFDLLPGESHTLRYVPYQEIRPDIDTSNLVVEGINVLTEGDR